MCWAQMVWVDQLLMRSDHIMLQLETGEPRTSQLGRLVLHMSDFQC